MKMIYYLGLVVCVVATLLFAGMFTYTMLVGHGDTLLHINYFNEGWPEVATLTLAGILGVIVLAKIIKTVK
jgi:hypothetical protein